MLAWHPPGNQQCTSNGHDTIYKGVYIGEASCLNKHLYDTYAYRYECHRVTGVPSATETLYTLDGNGTEFRCGCSLSWGMDGEACDQPKQPGAFYLNTILLSLLTLVVWGITLNGFHMSYTLVANLRKNKKAMNIATFACIVITIGLVFDSILLPFYVFRQTNIINNNDFNNGNIFLPGVVFFACGATLCVALAWIDIAQNAMKKGSAGGKRVFKATKLFLYFFMTFVMISSIGLTVLNKTGAISLLGVVIIVVLSICMRYGGNKIKKLLDSLAQGGAGKTEPGKSIGETKNIFMCSACMIVLGATIYNLTMASIHVDGLPNGYGVAIGINLMFVGVLGW